ncbi:amidohydrolase family protein [Saccharothrix variisporea]|uniref:Amidohydrolase family protein n=1 Tax=Saccharothrix variisporea TaxID=543527 RepID=A0A495X213_9PSEU|nr:amidohydrolase family protein [Saccharothrix variisporea]RKT67536.1 amidohydrolase family protein [Saccharothrix variisporea]
MTTVDVHCHVFNADDLPVYGFVQRVFLHNAGLGAAVAGLLDFALQGFAADHAHDLARLDTLLVGADGLESVQPAVPRTALDAQVESAYATLAATNPDLLAQAGAALAAEEGVVGQESLRPGDVRRLLRFVTLFARSRLDLVADLVADFQDELDLAVPLLVDLGTGLGDSAVLTGRQQVVLFEKLSRASMLGVLPDAGKVRLHPFVGFDPLRQLRAERAEPIETPLDLVKLAVREYGFVGVKVYPPMGWRPTGNRPRPGLSEREAKRLDDIVDALAAWCVEEHVPITAHSADSIHADEDYLGFGDPGEWVALLDRHPGLHLNLGHFGGAAEARWPHRIAEAMATHPGLYADVGNHGVGSPAEVDAYFALLRELSKAYPCLGQRLMYGSDWYMVAQQRGYDRFLDTYRSRYEAAFGPEARDAFLGANALSFLGFDDPDNRNATRLAERYSRFAPERMPSWLEHPPHRGGNDDPPRDRGSAPLDRQPGRADRVRP